MSTSTDPSFLVRDSLYIDGRWVPSQGDGRIEVVDSNTGRPMGSVPKGAAADADAAARAARRAFDGWAATPLPERAAWLQKIADALATRAEALNALIAREVGTPLAIGARVQVGLPLMHWKLHAQMGRELSLEERVGNSLVVREPVGVVAAITPWNFPLNQITLKLAPALLAGCTVVLKPSEIAPFNAYLLADAIHEVGLPAGVFNLISGEGPDVGEALVTHPEVDCISFTGSTRAGKRISELAAREVKRVRLELGGKSPSVVLPSADLAGAITASMGNCFMNSGQMCVALTRLLVPRERLDEARTIARQVAEAYPVGRAQDAGVRMGPLVSKLQHERVRASIARGITSGAELVTGGMEAPQGLEDGFFVKPTVFVVDDPKSPLAQDEIFGPVLTLMPYDSVDDALRIANDTAYGLGGAVWAGSDEEAVAAARRIRTGQVTINGGPYNPAAPFGGFKQSGHGREGGRFGLDEFLEYKAMQLPVPA